jgi:polysaccharide biosynthesis protein PelC
MNYKNTGLIILFLGTLLVFGCAPRPSIYSQAGIIRQPVKGLAILPFVNLSGQENAGKLVANAFLVELLKEPGFKIIEPGEIEVVMRNERIRSADQIDYQTAKILKDKLKADYILIGAVNEYAYFNSGSREIPRVSFSVRILDSETGKIVWAAYQSRKGDDKELIFGWGLINSLPNLTVESVKQVLKKM